MLLDEIKNIKSSNRDLEKFGLTLGIFFAVLAALFLWRHKHGFFYLFVLANFFLALAWLAPRILKPIQKAWMTLALLMGWVMTRVLLSIVFYLVMTPIGIIARLTGKKFLDMKKSNGCESYWNNRKPLTRKKEDYEKQY